MASITVLVSKLDFDLANPRYAAQNSQREAFERILLDSPSKTIALAEHIVNNGQNPIDLIAVMATDNNRYHLFDDSVMTVAAIDRLVHHATIMNCEGESYRRKASLKRMVSSQ